MIVLLLCAGPAPAAEPVEMSLPDLDGTMHKLSDYRGKWVVVNYWATWCPPCLDEIPDLIDFHEAHKDRDAVVLGVNYEDITLPSLHQFVETLFINYPVLRSSPAMASPLGMVPGLPTTFMISPDGVPVAQQVGPITSKALEAFIARKTQAPRAAAPVAATVGTN